MRLPARPIHRTRSNLTGLTAECTLTMSSGLAEAFGLAAVDGSARTADLHGL
jgi:hypothetical protein